MSDDVRGATLPYRTDDADLLRFVGARARGRTLPQIRTLNFSPKSFEGTLRAAEALGLIDREGALLALGRRYALASAEQRAAVLCEIIAAYPPYALLVEAAFQPTPPQMTPLDWVQTWWATHDFGSSESNRAEAAPVFARLVHAAGGGQYIQGRKGHVSRIEWAAGVSELLLDARAAAPDRLTPLPVAGTATDRLDDPPPPETSLQPHGIAIPTAPAAEPAANGGSNILRWELSPGRTLRLEVPAHLRPEEKTRLLRLLELLLES